MAKTIDINEKLEQELDEAKLSDMVRVIDDMPDIDVACTSTGLIRLDTILHNVKLGMAEARDIEIISDEPESGKTSLCLQIAGAWQHVGKRVAICDIAGTITTPHMRRMGMITHRETAGMHVPLWVNTESEDGGPKPAEEILDSIRILTNIVDLIIVDDVPSLIESAELDKDADENARVGGIAKSLTNHMRKTSHKRATVLWINQRREKTGGGMPGRPPKKVSMAGKAIPFWASIRLVLAMTEKIKITKDGAEEIIGMKVQAETVKNKTSPPFKKTLLTYLDEEGFSNLYDYIQLGVKASLIEKSGSRYTYKDMKSNGEWNFYRELKANPELKTMLMSEIDALIKENVKST